MEMDQMPQAGPGPGMCGSDREIFERVWRRVMPEDRCDSPIMLIGDEESLAVQVPAQVPVPTPTPMQTTVSMSPAFTFSPPIPGNSICAEEGLAPKPDNDVPCLGASSAVHGAQLQDFILRELKDYRTYHALSRKCGGPAARTLATMAADERRHAKRLSTAYFLISGVRYWPLDQATAQLDLAYAALLRRHFAWEQMAEAGYLAAAESTADPCLRELYIELAGDENSHAWLLRGILEAM